VKEQLRTVVKKVKDEGGREETRAWKYMKTNTQKSKNPNLI
jgi:hypothetical protein